MLFAYYDKYEDNGKPQRVLPQDVGDTGELFKVYYEWGFAGV